MGVSVTRVRGAGQDGSGLAAGHAPAAGHDAAAQVRTGGLVELVLAGLVAGEDELLGDLAEGRAHHEASDGATAARRWYRRQAVLAVPRLLWLGLRTRAGRVALGIAGAWAVNLAVLAALGPTGLFDSRYTPTAQEVLRTTLTHGTGILVGGLLAGAVAAALSRGARLVPVAVVAVVSCLWAWEGPFYAAYGPARPTGDGSFVVELGASSHDLVIPALWQLPTMSVLMPTMTVLGGLAAVAWTRRRAARGPQDDVRGR